MTGAAPSPLSLGAGRIVPASLDDLLELDSLRRTEQESVGFIPMSKYEEEVERRKATVLTMRENGDMVGYLYWTRGFPVATIQQVVIRQDARRRERATSLVDAATQEMSEQGRAGVTCRCRVDLDAVAFWEACGFERIRLEDSGRRGPLIRFYKALSPSLLEPSLWLRGPEFGRLAKQRRGFRVVPA